MSSLDAISLHCILITLRDLILESLAKCKMKQFKTANLVHDTRQMIIILLKMYNMFLIYQ